MFLEVGQRCDGKCEWEESEQTVVLRMPGIGLFGNISTDELQQALRKSFPNRNVKIMADYDSQAAHADPNEIVIAINIMNSKEFKTILSSRDKHIQEIETVSSKALTSVQTLHKQQQALFDEFVLLRQRYDEQKVSLLNILWQQCTLHHPDLKNIPVMEDENFEESENRVGDFNVGDALGEGQFATVRSCWKDDSRVEYALKIIKKDRITSFIGLKRISNEIGILRDMKSPNIVSITEVFHTSNKLYIVTEKGGSDLFDFFDEHPDGVPEKWAREIITNVLRGVLYCHENFVCHRDLKPENILLEYNPVQEICEHLKLCDFGLSTTFAPKTLLTDFCGSPGFFAPEMIIYGSYFGDKADIWSVGCILLELVLGHERFCDAWMTAYDYETLQDKQKFTSEIQKAVAKLPSLLDFSSHLNDFILCCLKLRSSDRISTRALCRHSWLNNGLASDVLEWESKTESRKSKSPTSLTSDNGSIGILSTSPSQYQSYVPNSGGLTVITKIDDNGATLKSPNSVNSPCSQLGANSKNAVHSSVDQEALKEMYIEERERRQIVDYIHSHPVEENHNLKLHLPPIEPATPSVNKARKILTKGNELAQRATEGNWNAAASTSSGTTPARNDFVTPVKSSNFDNGSTVGRLNSLVEEENSPMVPRRSLSPRFGNGNDVEMSPTSHQVGSDSLSSSIASLSGVLINGATPLTSPIHSQSHPFLQTN